MPQTQPTHTLKLFLQLGRCDKLIGFWLLLIPALWTLCLTATDATPIPFGDHVVLFWAIPRAQGWWLLLVFSLGSFLMRTAGCILNDIADKDIDPKVARTRMRPLAQRKIPVYWALACAVCLILLAGLLVLLGLNRTAFYACHIALLLAIAYPYAKRYLNCPQSILALAFSSSIPIAVLAQQQPIDTTVWALWMITILWILLYDSIYALADYADDQALSIGSSIKLLGKHARIILSTGLVGWLGLWISMACVLKWHSVSILILACGGTYNITNQIRRLYTFLPEQATEAFKLNAQLGWLILLAICLR